MNTISDAIDILSIKNVLVSQTVNHVAFFSDNKRQILAIVLSNNDIVLWKTSDENTGQIIKWIPWKNNENTKIKALTFQPASLVSTAENKIQLLVVTFNGTIYLISVEKIINGEAVQSSNTQFSLYPSCPFSNFSPTAVAWWNSSHFRHKNIAIIGGSNGQIIFYSLTCAHYVTTMNTESKIPIFSLSICNDFFQEYCYLLITNDLRQQWKLLLEKEVNGVLVVSITFENLEETDKTERSKEIVLRSQKSRLQEFKQISVETFIMLKQKLNESRKVTLEKVKNGSTNFEPSELQSCDCYGEAFLSVQQYKNRYVLTGLFIPDSVLLLYLQNKESMTLIHHKFKCSPLVTTLLLTHTFIYIADIIGTQHRVLVFSTQLSEVKKNEAIEYNPDSFLQSFLFPEEEQIINLFKMEAQLPTSNKLDISEILVGADMQSTTNNQILSKIKQSRLQNEWNEVCLVVTNRGAYVIGLKSNPLILALDYVKNDINVFKRLPLIFNIPLSKMIEIITVHLVQDKRIDEAMFMCNTFKWYSAKVSLKLASMGFIEEALQYTGNVLNQSDFDSPLVEKIHLSNFLVTCYIERYLRHSSDKSIQTQFLKFLKENRFYDEEMNIHILGNYRLCSFVHYLCILRGLYVDCTVALTNMLAQNFNDKFRNLHRFEGFWQLFSEISLVDAFVLSPRTVHLHIYFLKEHMNEIPGDIPNKLYQFYDPMQPVLRPAICRMLRCSREEYQEAYDFESDKWGSDANMIDWITNFMFLHIYLNKKIIYEYSLKEYVSEMVCPSIPVLRESSVTLSEPYNSVLPPVLYAGFAHSALVRNGSLVTWGISAYGCLGAGPTLSQNCAPLLNPWFENHKIRVKHVACGRHHTIALTENGVYAWGSSKFGQLGIGSVHQSVYPRLVDSLSSFTVISIDVGQYHSLAIDTSGKLWTWGWGVYGQLGHGSTEDQLYPKCVQRLEKKFIIHACGGQAHTTVLTKSGKVYTFGCNTYGQLGIGTTNKSTIPVKVFGIQEKVVMIATNYFHNLALSDSNRLYQWGCSPQILKLHAQSQKRAKSISNVIDKTDVAVHIDHKCNSNVELIEIPDSKYTIENASYDSFSVSSENSKHLSPTLIDTSMIEGKIKQISCGMFHSALLTTNSQIYTWGRNMDGQLGNSKRQADLLVPTLVNIFPIKMMSNKQQVEMLNRPLWSVSCGRDYTLVVELESRLFGWGNNSCGQLGTLPQEDFSIKRFLNGKFIVNKYSKRMIKLSHSGVNVIEKPVEIISLPKFPFMFSTDSIPPDRYLQVECNLQLPGFSELHYPIQNARLAGSGFDSSNKILHYYLECFHQYYNAEFMLQICAESNNFQAMSKVCCLNYKFSDAFFYGLKALLSYVRENYYFTSFNEYHYDDVSKNCVIPKTSRREMEISNNNTYNDFVYRSIHFEFIEDIISEALSLFEKYYKMVMNFTPNEVGAFLNKSVSVWIVWEMPLKPLENLLLQYLNNVAYPLAVFLFCDHYQPRSSVSEQTISNFSQIENNTWKEKQLHLSTYLQKKNKSLSAKSTKYPFSNNSETKMCYRNLYQSRKPFNLESNDNQYELTSDEILRYLSVGFILKLCNVIAESMSNKSAADYEEFVKLLHRIIFSPSILKSDDRNPNEILSSVLNALHRNQSPRKKFIQISYEELRDKSVENKFIVFSCSHYYISQFDYEREVASVIHELDRLRLLSTSELVNQLFTDSNFATCCPNCLLQYIESEVSSIN